MIPIADYTTLAQDATVREAINKLRESFYAKVSTSRIMERGHRSIVVFDETGKTKGILAIIDLLNAVMPAYLNAPKP
jgi:CBS domain-containing protein